MKKTDVLNHFGSQANVAKALTDKGYRISQPAVCKWPEDVPSLRAFQIERITNGKLSAELPQPNEAA
jgi:arginine repressor